MVKQKFDLGAPIFGKVKGYAPWPGTVAAITSKNRFGKKIFRTMCLDIKYKFDKFLLAGTECSFMGHTKQQSRDEGKVCDDEEYEKGGLPRGAFGDRRETPKCCCGGNGGGEQLGRIEEIMMKEPSESDVVEAGCCAAKSTTANVHKMHKKYEMLTFAVLLPENLGWS